MELLLYGLCVVLFLGMAWLFSWRIPAFILYVIMIAGILVVIGYFIGIGFKAALGPLGVG